MMAKADQESGPEDGRKPGEIQPERKWEQPAPNQASAPQLSPEEQMALFEKELKESDWGHQPC